MGRSTFFAAICVSVLTTASALASCASDASPVPPHPPPAIDVADFGARGDGVTDDRAAVQAALTRAHEIGATIKFPAGKFMLASATAPGDRILQTYPDQHLSGAGRDQTSLIVSPKVGNYVTVIGAVHDSTAIGSWSLSRLTVNQSASLGGVLDVASMLRAPRMVVRLGDYGPGAAISVIDSAFVDTDNVNTLYLFAQDITVARNVFERVGGPVGAPTHDHSSIYLTATVRHGAQSIQANVFTGVRSAGGARTAIETHGGRQDIQGNTVTNYVRGMNITGVASVSAEMVSIRGNRLERVAIGVQLWAELSPSSSTRPPLQTVQIDQNTIILDGSVWGTPLGLTIPTTGILVNPANTAAIGKVRITRNSIVFVSVTPSARHYTAAISCRITSGARSIQTLEVVGNWSTAAPTWIGSTCPVDESLVNRNTIR